MGKMKRFMADNDYFEMSVEEQTKFSEDFENGLLNKEIEELLIAEQRQNYIQYLVLVVLIKSWIKPH